MNINYIRINPFLHLKWLVTARSKLSNLNLREMIRNLHKIIISGRSHGKIHLCCPQPSTSL